MRMVRSLVMISFLLMVVLIPASVLENTGFFIKGLAGPFSSSGWLQCAMICFVAGIGFFTLNMIIETFFRPRPRSIEEIAAVEDETLRDRLLAESVNGLMRPTVIPGGCSTLPVVVLGPLCLLLAGLLKLFGR